MLKLRCLILLLIALLTAPSVAAPASGLLRTSDYLVDEQGAITGEKTTSLIRFAGNQTRLDIWKGERLTEVQANGDAHWIAYPQAGRVRDTPIYWRNETPLAAKLRSESPLTDETYLIETRLQGIACWEFRKSFAPIPDRNDIAGSAAYDATFWIYPDKDFPLVLQYRSSNGVRSDLLEFVAGATFEPHIFEKPANLKPILPFRLPDGKFSLQTEETTTWDGTPPTTKVVNQTYDGDGDSVTATYRSQTRHGDNRTTDFVGEIRRSLYRDFRLSNPLAPGFLWQRVSLIGHEKLPLGEADIFELPPQLAGFSTHRYWIVDHPIFGSIVAQKTETSEGKTVVTRITKFAHS